ncbi:MAG: hypothetical protein Q4A04_05130 [Eubacteriales bacterium]|nr:hypothetical protein [Eubacteriales bacterium]
MSLFSNLFKTNDSISENKELLENINNSLVVSAENSKILANALINYMGDKSSSGDDKSRIANEDYESEGEKFRAAYALNLCTVSISQIIEYNDINFMEREYDAILNNLNLENMPKDEALLNILKQLLDVITYFRIENQEKQLLDKKYERRMKDAIWSAVPNFSFFISTPTRGTSVWPWVASLALQVGTAYMNYRKAKSVISLEKEEDLFRLQRSAIEQFNGLRRELFDTAWRLSKEHHFEDRYRLTERQISQFNNILLDDDNARRYGRLKFIKKWFDAYPPFNYYFGSAANAASKDWVEKIINTVSSEKELTGDDLMKEVTNHPDYKHVIEYKKEAICAFEEFSKQTDKNLLREDVLASQCALEYFDLLDDSDFNELSQEFDIEEKRKDLIKQAKENSAGSLDVLQLCAMSYLRINDTEDAEELFENLVAEEYNREVNAQLLSQLYVEKIINAPDDSIRENYSSKYDDLHERVSAWGVLLFPKISTKESDKEASEKFIEERKNQLQSLALNKFSAYINKCDRVYEELSRKNGSIANEVIGIICSIGQCVQEILPGYYTVFRNNALDEIDNANQQNKRIANGLYDIAERRRGDDSVTLGTMIAGTVENLGSNIRCEIDKLADQESLSKLESRLLNCAYDIHFDVQGRSSADFRHLLEKVIFTEDYVKQNVRENWIKEARDIVKNATLVKDGSKNVELITQPEEISNYWNSNNKGIEDKIGDQDEIIGIISEKTTRALYISIRGMLVSERVAISKKHRGCFAEYTSLHVDPENSPIFIGSNEYSNDAVYMENLNQLVKDLTVLQDGKMSTITPNLSNSLRAGFAG